MIGPALIALAAVVLLLLGDATAEAGGNTYTVNSDLDPGDGVCDVTCTLRDAIISANASPGHDSIAFDPNGVPGAIYIIKLSSLLPPIEGAQGITIDGTGLFARAVITGELLVEDGSGLFIRGDAGGELTNVHLRRLALTDFSHYGVNVCAGELPDTCGYDLSNVEITDVIGDDNGRTGISVRGADIKGLDVTGFDAFDNGHHGLSVEAQGDLLDVVVDEGRAIGNGLESISVINNSPDGDLQDVRITNSLVSGGAVIVGSEGPVQVVVLDSNESLGGGFSGFNVYSNGGDLTSVDITDNTVSGADIYGINVSNDGTPQLGAMSDVRIEDNTVTGTGRTGIHFEGVSGPEPNVIEGNTLSGNGWDAIDVQDSEGVTGGARVKISRNATYSNAQLGIDLYKPGEAPPGVTPNDVGDGDQGPNGLLNSPEFSAPTGYSQVNGQACANCVIEIFVSDNDPSGHGEGQQFLFDLTAGSSGDFVVPLCGLGLVAGAHITATATDPLGNTSEFSANYTLLQDSEPCPTASPSPTPSAAPTATSSPAPRKQGDVDCNNVVNGRDALRAAAHAAGSPFLQLGTCPAIGSGNPQFGDVTCANGVGIPDVVAILQYSAGLNIKPPQPGGCTPLGQNLPS
jgi:parallel beta-helix repeat protein